MPVQRRGQAIDIGSGQPGSGQTDSGRNSMFNGRRQPSHGGTSRMMREYQVKAANLIDHCGPLADQARPDPVQRLQIQLLVGFGWNKACRRPLYRLSYGMGISEIILVPLPKGL